MRRSAAFGFLALFLVGLFTALLSLFPVSHPRRINYSSKVFGVVPPGAPAREVKREGEKPVSMRAIQDALQNMKGEELSNFLDSFYWKNLQSLAKGENPYTDREIAEIVASLAVVRDLDTYKRKDPGKGGKGGVEVFYPNRDRARVLFPIFEAEELANTLSLEPPKERIQRSIVLLNSISFPHPAYRYLLATLCKMNGETFADRVADKLQPHMRVDFGIALLGFHPQAGASYLIQLLADEAIPNRGYIIDSFESRHGEEITRALIDALRDTTYDDHDRSLAQLATTEPSADTARDWAIRRRAAAVLSSRTGQRWSWMFEEDHDTWNAWYKSTDKPSFSPYQVKRTGEELEDLVDKLYDRFLTKRPNPYAMSNELWDASVIRSLAHDLEVLDALPLAVKSCRAHIQQVPLQREELTSWTAALLREVHTEQGERLLRELREENGGATFEERYIGANSL